MREMSVAYECVNRRRPRASGLRVALVIGLALGGALTGARAQTPETLTVVLDQARITKLPERVATVVVGNPLIADVSVQAGGLLIVTGKGYGFTNLIALDRSGQVLLEKRIAVEGPREDVVVLFRGADRETYSCAPNCERRITLGDSPAFFDPTLAQIGSRNGGAGGAGAAPPPR
jgi:hypothetical protein